MSFGQCVCACSSFRKTVRTVGDSPQAAQDRARAIKTSTRARVAHEATVLDNTVLIIGVFVTPTLGDDLVLSQSRWSSLMGKRGLCLARKAILDQSRPQFGPIEVRLRLGHAAAALVFGGAFKWKGSRTQT